MELDSNIKNKKVIPHTQMPNKMTERKILRPKDCLVYLAIKSHCNQVTKICNPGLDRLKEITGASINTIKKSIRALIELKYIERKEYKKGYNYIFAEYDKFEPFTYDFLYNKELDYREKAYLATALQYMKLEEDLTGIITFNNIDLADRLNISYDTLIRIEESLTKKGLLAKVTSNLKDRFGCFRPKRIYNLLAIGLGYAYWIKNLDNRVTQNTDDITYLKDRIRSLESEVKELKQELFLVQKEKIIEQTLIKM